MIKLKGLGAAEDLNGFMDEGTEFLGELRFRERAPHRRPAEGQDRLRQHPDRRGDRPRRSRHRLRGGLHPGHRARARARPPADRAPRRAPGCRPPSSPPSSSSRTGPTSRGSARWAGPAERPRPPDPARASVTDLAAFLIPAIEVYIPDDRRAGAHPPAHRAGRLRRLSEQARPRRARPGPGRPRPQRRPPRPRGLPHGRRRRRLSPRRDHGPRPDRGLLHPGGGRPLRLRGDRRRERPLRRLRDGRPAPDRPVASRPSRSRTFPRSGRRRSCAAEPRSCEEAGCALLGGHSVRDPEIKFGYAVTGLVDPRRVLTNAGGKPGDVLVLTKPLGHRRRSPPRSRPGWRRPRRSPRPRPPWRRSTPRPPRRRGGTAPTRPPTSRASASLGHALQRLARESRLTLEIHARELPLLPGALALAARYQAGGLKANRREFEPLVEYRVTPARRSGAALRPADVGRALPPRSRGAGRGPSRRSDGGPGHRPGAPGGSETADRAGLRPRGRALTPAPVPWYPAPLF